MCPGKELSWSSTESASLWRGGGKGRKPEEEGEKETRGEGREELHVYKGLS